MTIKLEDLRVKFVAALLFAIATGSFVMSSCSEEIVEKEAELGKEASTESMSKAINKVFEGISLENAQLHSRVLYESNQRVELGPVEKTGTIENELIGIKDYENATGYVLLQTVKRYEDEKIVDDKTSELQPLLVAKQPPQLAAEKIQPTWQLSPMQLNASFSLLKSAAITTLGTDCDGVDQTDEYGNVFDCIRYFRLRTQLRRVAPPAPVRARANCMNIPNCLMTIRYIAYDEVKWRDSRAVARNMLEAEVAPEVPDIMYRDDVERGWQYSPPVYSFCDRSLIANSKGQKFLVAFCTVLRDFYVP